MEDLPKETCTGLYAVMGKGRRQEERRERKRREEEDVGVGWECEHQVVVSKPLYILGYTKEKVEHNRGGVRTHAIG